MHHNKKLHFMHLPKTGGSSLWSYLEFQFKLDEICPAIFLYNTPPLDWIKTEHMFENLLLKKNDLLKYNVFKGHLGWTPRTLFPATQIETITFLRDPVERILSIYGHIARDKAAFPTLSQRWDNFNDFIFDSDLEYYLADQQSKHFCADMSDKTKRLSLPELSELVGIWAFNIHLSTTEIKNIALKRLHECAFVGLIEEYHESLQQLCMQKNWLFPKQIPKLNITNNRLQKTDLSSKVLDRIMELNQLDTILYQEAVKIFQDNLRIKVAFNQNRLEEKVYKNLPTQEMVDFNFEDKIIGEGWHTREGQSPNTYCWSNKHVSTLIFSIKPTSHFLMLSFHVLYTTSSDCQKKLTVLANSHPLSLTWKVHPEGGIIFKSKISTNILSNNILKLTFLYSEVVRPCSINKNNRETRALGFACKSLTLTPHKNSKKHIKRLKAFKAKLRKLLAPKLGNLTQYHPKTMALPFHYKKNKKLQTYPKISLVTPSFNQGCFIERTIQSILNQKYHPLEYIIQDGGSSDNTVEIIKKYTTSLKYWTSTSDNGQSHAINLGFQHATGDIMAYLNSDDILLPGALHYIASFFNKHPDIDIIYGHRILIDENNNEIGKWILPPHHSTILSWADYIPQETLFWRTRIWEKVGAHINENFQFAMDWDLLLRFRDAGAKFARLPRFLGAFRVHTKQKTSAEISKIGLEEMQRIRHRMHGRHTSDIEIKNATRNYLYKHLIYHFLYRLKILNY